MLKPFLLLFAISVHGVNSLCFINKTATVKREVVDHPAVVDEDNCKALCAENHKCESYIFPHNECFLLGDEIYNVGYCTNPYQEWVKKKHPANCPDFTTESSDVSTTTDSTITTTEEEKGESESGAESEPMTTTQTKKWVEFLPLTANIICDDNECYCKENFELSVRVGNTNYTGLRIHNMNNIIANSLVYLVGETSSSPIEVGIPHAMDCVPSDRGFGMDSKCWTPVVINGKYTATGITCDSGKTFDRAEDKSQSTCFDIAVLKCVKGRGFACKGKTFPLTAVYCN